MSFCIIFKTIYIYNKNKNKNKKYINMDLEVVYEFEIDGSLGIKKVGLKAITTKIYPKVFGLMASKPTEEQMENNLSLKAQYLSQVIEAGMIILQNCFVSGDSDVLTLQEYFQKGALEAINVFDTQTSKLKKK